MAEKKKYSLASGILLVALAVLSLILTDGKDVFQLQREATQEEQTENVVTTDTGLDATSDNYSTPSNYEIPYLLDNENNEIIEHMGFTLSYNEKYRIPNWVAYELKASELYGDFDRQDKFTPDPDIKGRQAYDRDYVGSGYDRGHMAPSGDMKWSSQAIKECFYLSNVCPQNHNLNKGLWNDLEKQIRYECKYYKTIWVVCGPIIEKNKYGTIGENKVKVPDAFFKAILTKSKKKGWISIGFVFPNESCNDELRDYAMTVDELEEYVGMDLFYNLPDADQQKAESKMDPNDWKL